MMGAEFEEQTVFEKHSTAEYQAALPGIRRKTRMALP